MPDSQAFPSSVAGFNRLPTDVKLKFCQGLIPPRLFSLLPSLPPSLKDEHGQDLLQVKGTAGSSMVELWLWHNLADRDPVFYIQLTDTANYRLQALLTIVNDIFAPRFDVDVLADGTPTAFGTRYRNLPAEMAAKSAGLAPAQVRKGLNLMAEIVAGVGKLASLMGDPIFFAEPLHYHNAILLERHGFGYVQGKRKMLSFDERFSPNGDLSQRLDGASPFRQPEQVHTVRGRSWAIHDGILGEPFTDVVMFRRVDQPSQENTFSGSSW
jgi:hypothetical protein